MPNPITEKKVVPTISGDVPREKLATAIIAKPSVQVDPVKAKEFFALKAKYLIGPTELNNLLLDQSAMVTIIDVRQAQDYAKGHLPGAINLPKDQWQTFAGLKKDKQNIVYCYSLECPLAAQAALEFAGKGYSVMELQGGFDGWQENHFKMDTQVHH